MNNNEKKSIIISREISKRKLNCIEYQINNVPEFWLERIKQDGWQLILTKKMPKELSGSKVLYFLDSENKKIWTNISGLFKYKNVIYNVVSYYVQLKYANVNNACNFARIVAENRISVSKFMKQRCVEIKSIDDIFIEVFVYILETNGINYELQIDWVYQYVKRWVYGNIFDRNIEIPKYINTSNYVSDEQIGKAEDAFNELPLKIKEEFLDNDFKIRIFSGGLEKQENAVCLNYEEKLFSIACFRNDIYVNMFILFGYILNYKESFVSEKNEFKEIFVLEKEKIELLLKELNEKNYDISNTYEYFATLFRMYMTIPNELKRYTPKSYNFINQIVEKWL